MFLTIHTFQIYNERTSLVHAADFNLQDSCRVWPKTRNVAFLLKYIYYTLVKFSHLDI